MKSIYDFFETIRPFRDFIMDLVALFTLFATLRVTKKVNSAVVLERLSNDKNILLGKLDSFTRKMEDQVNCTPILINEIKNYIQEITTKYSVLNSINTTLLLRYLSKSSNLNCFKIRKKLLRLTTNIERMV